jgi:hypothetical protein
MKIMQILNVKNITQFNEAVVPEDSLLVFPEQQPDGSFVWKYKDSSGNEGTLGGESGGTSGITCVPGAGVAVGILVYITEVDGVLTCLPADLAWQAADGCVVSIKGEEALLAQNGIVTLVSGLAAGTELFLGANGSFTGTSPAASGETVQKVGRVIDANTVYFNIHPGRTIV